MSILPIITPENPILRKKAIKVTNFNDKKLQQLIDDMIETLKDAPGVGLAAPQVAESRRLIIVRLPDETDDDRQQYGEHAGVEYVVANPKIIKSSKNLVTGVEGCLSIPGILGEVDRPDMVVVTGQDREGNDFRIKAKGWLARVFLHEIDHLDGRLFIDLTDKIWQIDEDGELLDEDADSDAVETEPTEA